MELRLIEMHSQFRIYFDKNKLILNVAPTGNGTLNLDVGRTLGNRVLRNIFPRA